MQFMVINKVLEAKPIWTREDVEEEVYEKSLRNVANHGFLARQGAAGRVQGLSLGTNAKKIVSVGNCWDIARQPRGIMETQV